MSRTAPASGTLRAVGRWCVGVLVRPRPAVASITRSATVGQGTLVTCGFGGLYALGALLADRAGHRPQGQVLTFVPPERYYRWEAAFVVPLTVAWMWSLATFVRAGARRLGGRGTARGDFAVLAVTHTMPLVVSMWLPDVVCYLLRLDRMQYARVSRLYIPLSTGWALALATLGTATAERIPWPRALAVLVAADAAAVTVSGVAVAMR